MPSRKHVSLPSAYQGREQAYVKHELLKAYLEKLFLIIGMSSSRLGISELCYVDCFAGPWYAENESLSDTSIGVSLRILDKCQKQLSARGMTPRFRALYIEKDDAAFKRLKTFLSERTPTGIESQPLHGDFVALRGQILSWCGKTAFAFFFVDPTGWKEVSIEVLKPLLLRRRSEFLINFMYDFVNRTASIPEWKAEITTLLGQPVEVDSLQASEREKLLLSTYRNNLKRELPIGGRSKARSAYVRVLDREKQRPKYHLVYVTGHPRGIIEFMEISEDIDLVQKQVRASTKQAARVIKTGIQDMFGDEVRVHSDAGHAPIAEVTNYWREYLSGGAKRVGEEEFASLLEDTDWFPGDFQRALKRLMDAGQVRNLDAPRARPKRPLHWENGGERLESAEGAK